MNVFNYKNDDEWYTLEKDIKYFLENINIEKTKKIWCPFDGENSNFVKVLKENGYNVVYSHKEDGKDFYNYEPANFDLIISNPPFSNKVNLIKRLKELNKPFALIFGIQCFSSGSFTKELKDLDLELIFLEKRMRFTKDINKIDKIPSPTFHSLWVCNNVVGQKITILEGVK